MSLAATRWLIERGTPGSPDELFLHVFDDGDSAWSPDRNRALRFVSEADAERYGSGLGETFHAVEVPTAVLAALADDKAAEDRDAG